MRESGIQRNILKALNALPQTKAINLHGSAYMEAGTPDLLCVSKGRVYFLEVKRPGHKATSIQQHVQRAWRDAGARVAVVTSASEALQVVSQSYPDSNEG
ncbi:VRR-NUC domain-containing protein [Alicyclobacillus tolerans]|uniref:VRR-NUC domain-containing protein n=1 Tax=Alicyclobacillus tolerans TaxID=90970 RepID=A0A1M6XTF7_9BACL|nr:VRR-NUC domain-containing protein [Alicyclobacillus montanus]SHL09234.1 hypothetical protein SAMN05443507_13713 [Alicyclobacillus montanus]